MSDIYIVTEYFGIKREHKGGFSSGFISEEERANIVMQDWSLLKIYAFKDKESAKILSSRISELNDSNYHCIKIDKRKLFPTDESLIDNNNIYAVTSYNDTLFKDDIDLFQDEINAEIHKLAIVKVSNTFFQTIKIPLSPELRLDFKGNFTSEPLYLDVWEQNGKKYKFSG